MPPAAARSLALGAVLVLVLVPAARAHADDAPPSVLSAPVSLSRRLAGDAAFTPGMLRAHDDASGFVVAATSLDGARDRAQLDALGEAHVYGPIRLIVRVADVFRDTARPGIGAGVQVLDEARHGISSTAYLQYKTEGFTEPEGELELVLAFGRRFGPLRAAVDLAYGQDPEGNERDGELALAGHAELVRGLFAGGVARYRDALGSTKEAIVRDGFGGATATLAFGRFGVTAMAGVAMVELRDMPRQVGPAATLAIGAAF